MAMLLVWTLLGLVVGLALGGGLHNLKVSHTAIVLLGTFPANKCSFHLNFHARQGLEALIQSE